ncbi:MAG: aminoglycoside phosphotransferase family protein [Chloroflexota bacterium]
MTNHVFTHSTDLTPAYLTDCLLAKGMLQTGRVVSIHEQDGTQSIVSTHHQFDVTYRDDATGESLPTSVLLKLSHPDFVGDPRFEKLEPLFYNSVVPQMQGVHWPIATPFVSCIDAVWSESQCKFHVLLVDMSSTHEKVAGYTPANMDLFGRVVDVLAHFHGFWWEHPSLGKAFGTLLTDEEIDGFEAGIATQLTAFKESADNDCTSSEFALLQQVLPAWPKDRRTRTVIGKGMTLVHRDPHPGNILHPRNPNTHDILLLDWQSWRIDFATDDLAYMMAFHWPADVRAHYEEMMLQRYYAKLVFVGVNGYTWDNFLYDYKTSILRFLGLMVRGWRHSFNRTRLKRGLQACQDWGCHDIVD